jgi:hypothetical protein
MLRWRNLHRLIHQCFFCKWQIEGKCQCKEWSLKGSKIIRIIPADGALAGSEVVDGCWILVWNYTR